ncbi:MnhB domain-containing protein [Streptomyces sp. INA 01156]
MLSVFLLFSGHYRPGGGFSGGLVAGLAFVLRYLVGGQADLGAAVRLRPVAVAGTGLVIAAVTALVPLAAGGAPLDSALLSWHLPLLGEVKWATSLFLDVGVYLVVVGVVLKLLAAVGVSLGEAGRRRPGKGRDPSGERHGGQHGEHPRRDDGRRGGRPVHDRLPPHAATVPDADRPRLHPPGPRHQPAAPGRQRHPGRPRYWTGSR